MTKRISLIGIGMGTEEGLTAQAIAVIQQGDCFIGATRMLEILPEGEVTYASYKPEEIRTYIQNHPEYEHVCILLSGDVGFYSGAKKLIDVLSEYKVELIPGISSFAYFTAKLNRSWDNMAYGSIHGRQENVIGKIQRNASTFVLLGNETGLKELLEKLVWYHMDQVTVHVGEALGYAKERVTSGHPSELLKGSFQDLCVAIVENPNPVTQAVVNLSDDVFCRGDVPMTKEEVRTVSIGKLQLDQDAVIYDIGAGTGSVSIQMALNAPNARIYAIERNPEGLQLIEENKRRFKADNIEMVSGSAPEVLEGLETPSYAFLGGTGGNMEEILKVLWKKNPSIRIVLNVVTLESLTEVMSILKKYQIREPELLQMSVAKARELGAYHLMMGQNPVHIITIDNCGNFEV